jgi:CheY-like chemotaxis protein/anti-sigma regulatory factor (Ser/Thr protein kinase)
LNLAEQRERKRLAIELHDYLQQTLILGKLKLGHGKRMIKPAHPCASILQETDDILSEALTYTRSLVAELSPPVLREHGLEAGLKWLAQYMKRYELNVAIHIPQMGKLNLPEAQAVLLFQSVRELLMNVWKHGGVSDPEVILEKLEDVLRIVVRDQGKGFDVKPSLSGKGLNPLSSKFGLLSIQERMNALGGTFHIESAPGSGTIVTLMLQLAKGNREANGVTSDKLHLNQTVSAAKEEPPSERIRVLLVDDHAMVRQGLRTLLGDYCDIEIAGEATNGEHAVELVEQVHPSLVVMDINMPKMNGIEATRRIRSRCPDIPVIGLSMNADQENQDAMAKAGAAMLITKEAAVDDLYAAIQQTIRAYRNHSALP